MVEGGNVVYRVNREGELSGRGKCPGNMTVDMSTGECPDRAGIRA